MKTIILDNIRIAAKRVHIRGLDNAVKEAVKERLPKLSFKYTGIHRKSIDARRKSQINYVISVYLDVDEAVNHNDIKNCRLFSPLEYIQISKGDKKLRYPPVIAGSGPSGLFCAYILALNGYNPIIVERGDEVDKRKKKVKKLWSEGELDPNTNVQFGEGGAGTFSDGKLVTRINDYRCMHVLDTFIKYGASPEIKYDAKPHIGTDILVPIIKGIREEIISLGGEFVFNSKMTDIDGDSKIEAVIINEESKIETDILVLAIGHSARDTYEMLLKKGVKILQKPFSVGLRIEHLQSDVNKSMWGKSSAFIPYSAEYAVHTRINNRGVYTFCMCPGGVVVNASSEQKHLVVNGMSYSARDGKNANSAWVAEVWPDDLDSKHPLAGVEFQRKIEKNAYDAGGGAFAAPVQKLGDFIEKRISYDLGRIKPSYTGSTKFCDFNEILPDFISISLKTSLGIFGSKLGFFNKGDAILTGCETRTSAPVRIERRADYRSVSHEGLYPAGEGAGYAGGIMSAAVDGMKVAESIIKLYNYPR